MNRFWEEAASILETAAAAGTESRTDIGIIIDRANGLRIIDASGWNTEALRREYAATSVFTVKRSCNGVTVEAQNGSERARLSKSLPGNPLASLMQTIPHHLVTPTRALIAAASSDK